MEDFLSSFVVFFFSYLHKHRFEGIGGTLTLRDDESLELVQCIWLFYSRIGETPAPLSVIMRICVSSDTVIYTYQI